MFISVIITAGGSGKRLNSKVKKQYLQINGKSILCLTIDKFYHHNEINEIIVTLPKNKDNKMINEIKTKYPKKTIKFANGGKERQDSVFNALKMCNKKADKVLIHDGVRPFVTEKDISNVINALDNKSCVILARKTVNTIKSVKNGKIIKTVDRTSLYDAFTPQGFDYNTILNLHIQAKEDGKKFTDDAAICEYYKKDVFVVETSNFNLKITTAEDFELAKKIINKGDYKNEKD